ncbi:MAG: DUF3717 domain-containing protein [Aquabacterium sp.]
MAAILIVDIEAAINWWRERRPSTDGISACPEVRALADVYGGMAWARSTEIDEAALGPAAAAAWLDWVASLPDSPCIAICSTAQGDAVCKGCGRREDEVQDWTALSPATRRAVWHRITAEGTAWRFNRYAERARLSEGTAARAAPAAVTPRRLTSRVS